MKNLSNPLENRWLVFVILAVLTILVSTPLFIDGWFWTHEEFSPIGRIVALTEEIRNGDFYPRWLSLSYRGKGSPFFNFYSPAFHFIAAYLHLAGLSLLSSIKIPLGLLFFVGAWGVYLWIRRRCGATGAAMAAVLYLFAPYHFVDIYVRGALAEFSAIALLPYLFYGIDLLVDESEWRKGFMVTVVSTALILLAHQLSAIMIAPFAILYSVSTIVDRGFSSQKLVSLLAAPLVAAGLSAFYWLPVLAEKKYLRDFAGAVLRGGQSKYYYYADHFVYPAQWLSSFWGFGGSVKGTGDNMSFQIGLVLLITAAIALLSLFASTPGKRFFPFQLLFLGVLAVFLTSEYSAVIYQLTPPLAFVQFPWRFLGPATLFIAAFAGTAAMSPIAGRFPIAILGVLISASMFFSSEQRRVSLPNVLISELYEQTMLKMRNIGGLNEEDEYLPKWADKKSIGFAPEIRPVPLSGAVTDVVVENKRMTFTYVGEKTDTIVATPWYFFPGWRARVDGQPVNVGTTPEGYLSTKVPVGRHKVEFFFVTTWPRASGWLIAGATLALFVAWSLKGLVLKGKRGKDAHRAS